MSYNFPFYIPLYWSSHFQIINDEPRWYDDPNWILEVETPMNYVEFVTMICYVMREEPETVTIYNTLVWKENGRNQRCSIHDDQTLCFLYSKWSDSPRLFITKYDNSEFDTVHFRQWQRELEAAGHTGVGSSSAQISNEAYGVDGGGENDDEEDDAEEEEHGDEEDGDESEEEEVDPLKRISDSEGNEDFYFGESDEPGTYAAFSDIGSQEAERVVTNSRRGGIWDRNPESIKAGTLFDSREQAQDAVKRWSSARAVEFGHARTDPQTWSVKCATRSRNYPSNLLNGIRCDWAIRVRYQPHLMGWQVVKWVDRHNCAGEIRDDTTRIMSYNDVADLIVEKIAVKPDYEIKCIQKDCLLAWKCKVKYDKCWQGRRKALERVYGSTEQNFSELPKFLETAVRSVPGTTVRWKHKKVDVRMRRNEKVFRYVFWSFGPCAKAFELCFPVVSVDGTHLRGSFKGKALIAMVKTANNRIMPIAYAIVDDETTHSWYWFLKYLKINLLKDRHTCVISDRHPGLLQAVIKMDLKFPGWGVHRYCLQHIKANFVSAFPRLKEWDWVVESIGRALQERKYEKYWGHLYKHKNAAAEWLDEIPAEKWTLFADGCHRWGNTTTNISESYNSVLRGDRFLPVRAFAEATYNKVVKFFAEEWTRASKCNTFLATEPMERFNTYRSRATRHAVLCISAPNLVFQVTSPKLRPKKGGNRQIVDMKSQDCSCGKWQTFRFICSHGMAVAFCLGHNVADYIHPCYTVNTWRAQFDSGFTPIPDPRSWEIPCWKLRPDDTRTVYRSGPGRNRLNHRTKGAMDYARKGKRREPRCTRCGRTGHNKQNCPVSHPKSDRQPLDVVYNQHGVEDNEDSDE